MKQKLISFTKPILYAFIAFSWIPGFSFPSAILLGEYAYPQNEEK